MVAPANVNGSWTLYVEDLVSGQQATLNSWSLGIGVQTVPEGGQWVMTALVLAGLVGFEARRRGGRGARR